LTRDRIIEGMVTRTSFTIKRKDCSSGAYATIMALNRWQAAARSER
jgi:hypothetical protein